MMVKYETEADESEEWEENDSTLEILSVCGVHRLECGKIYIFTTYFHRSATIFINHIFI